MSPSGGHPTSAGEPACRVEPALTPGSLFVVSVMMLALPLVAWQGPAHMVAMDGVNALFLAIYWCHVLVRREPVAFPLLVPLWLIVVGSLGGLYAAIEPDRGLLAVAQEIYLYLWFVTVVDYFARRFSLPNVVTVWAAVASAIALATYFDNTLGVLGGRFGGVKRAAGTFLNPNMFGDYLVDSFFVAWAAAAAGRRLLYIVALPALALGVLATASNGSLLSLLVGSVVVAVAYPTKRLGLRVGLFLVAAAIGLAAVGAWKDQVVEKALDKLSSGRSEIGGAAMKGAGERFPLWLDAIESLKDTPLGVGPANFNRQGGPISGAYHGAHNDYVGMLAERGPFGLAGWCGILLGTALTIKRLRANAAAGLRPLGVEPLYGLLAAIAVHSLTIEAFHFRHFWLSLAMVYAAAAQVEMPKPVLVPVLREAA